MRNQLSKIKICFNLKVCFQLKIFFENFQILREVVWTVKWTPAYPSTKLTNYQQPIHLQIFPSCLFKWMLQTSRHFTANHFSVNHPWQEHFLSNNNVLPLRKLALIQNCDVTCKMFSVVAKMSVMDTYNPTENLVKIDELSLIISLHFSQSVKVTEFPAILPIRIFEKSRHFVLQKNSHFVLINMFTIWLKSNIFDKIPWSYHG